MDLELALLAILAVVTALLIVAQWARIPYPILLVLGGLALAAIPGIPAVELDPDLVLVAILPPLLYAAAFFTADAAAAAQADPHHHPLAAERDSDDRRPWQTQELVECRGDAHAGPPRRPWFRRRVTLDLEGRGPSFAFAFLACFSPRDVLRRF